MWQVVYMVMVIEWRAQEAVVSPVLRVKKLKVLMTVYYVLTYYQCWKKWIAKNCEKLIVQSISIIMWQAVYMVIEWRAQEAVVSPVLRVKKA